MRSFGMTLAPRRLLPLAAALSALVLSGCGGPMADLFAGNEYFAASKMGVSASPRVTTSRNVPKGGGRYQVGQPYTVAGQRFVPREQPDLDVIGKASWYGPAFHGRLTANGEIFDQYHLSGAHPTLPLPSYVRVTNVSNGNSTLVRINDRGPFSNSRVIDLSRRTAEVLGYTQQGVANVRVQYVGPAPLEGDDTRFLVSSINQLTQFERMGETRMAYFDGQAGTGGDALAAVTATSEPGAADDLPFALLGYGAGGNLDVVDDISEPMGTPVEMVLGVFSDPDHAQMIAQEFALLGAVEQVRHDYQHGTAIQLGMRHLREGVTGQDVHNLADQLGLAISAMY